MSHSYDSYLRIIWLIKLSDISEVINSNTHPGPPVVFSNLWEYREIKLSRQNHRNLEYYSFSEILFLSFRGFALVYMEMITLMPTNYKDAKETTLKAPKSLKGVSLASLLLTYISMPRVTFPEINLEIKFIKNYGTSRKNSSC